MDFGLPCDLTWYKLLTDWGGLIGGGAALLAGAAAYIAGVNQANATRKAAKDQIDAIDQQRREEIQNVSDAVRIEVTTYTKYVIGALNTCERVAAGTLNIPRQDANYLSRMLYDAQVYPTVADRIGLLANPATTVEFYMRISEAKASAAVLAAKTDPQSATFVSAPASYITRGDVAAIADSLITALQLAQSIVAANHGPDSRAITDAYVQKHTLNEIGDALKSAQATFPNAESFKTA